MGVDLERLPIFDLFTNSLQMRVNSRFANGPVSQELVDLVINNSDFTGSFEHIGSNPRPLTDGLKLIQRKWQKQHHPPMQRPFLAARVVLESNARPMLIDAINSRLSGDHTNADLTHDLAFGIVHVMTPFVEPRIITGREIESGLNKAMDKLNKRFPVFRQPLHVQDQLSRAVGDIADQNNRLFMLDRTGFDLVDHQVNFLEGMKSETYAWDLVLKGADVSRRLYKAIYPLTEGIAPEL